ncbi:MAG: hypothetical protein CYPHOPRED_000688 [Cyphobasidiales sp. Tagirdzhanova-0007]|nr:MAG: hypothetical protein CYPHOPRED_000688 [Cyphobasidiales sp. Tagirdzhanova-0007]
MGNSLAGKKNSERQKAAMDSSTKDSFCSAKDMKPYTRMEQKASQPNHETANEWHGKVEREVVPERSPYTEDSQEHEGDVRQRIHEFGNPSSENQ